MPAIPGGWFHKHLFRLFPCAPSGLVSFIQNVSASSIDRFTRLRVAKRLPGFASRS